MDSSVNAAMSGFIIIAAEAVGVRVWRMAVLC